MSKLVQLYYRESHEIFNSININLFDRLIIIL